MTGILKAMRTIVIAVFIIIMAVGCSGGGGSGGLPPVTDNNRPVADAGPDQDVLTGVIVTLDGSQSSDPDNDFLNYQWYFSSKPSGSAADLSSAEAEQPAFTPDVDGEYKVTLMVNDGPLYSTPDDVIISSSPADGNWAPVAKPGLNRCVFTGVEVTLDGSKSYDRNNDTLEYEWTIISKPTGSSAALSDSTAEKPTFDADLDGIYVISLTVYDGKRYSTPTTVTITADPTGCNNKPTAYAGPDQYVETSTTVTLDGSGSSDTEDDPLTYLWSFSSIPGSSTAVLSDTAAEKPTFTADVDGDYVVSLTVSDPIAGDSSADTVTITAGSIVTISGTITFDYVPTTTDSGLAYGNTVQRPVRGTVLEVIRDSDDQVLNTTTTDSSGDYTVNAPGGTDVFIRVKAQMLKTGSPAWNFQVVDNTSGKALYVMDDNASFNTGAGISNKDLNAGSGWNGSSYGDPRTAGPFAILDTVYKAVEKVLTANSSEEFQELKINWSVNNIPAGGLKSDGFITVSHFDPSDGQLYILGAENVDTEEYDDHVIAHEFGHYFEHFHSRSDSLGGSHSINNDRLDPRIAFGEGFGNGFSGIVTDDPYYIDTMGDRQGDTGIWLELDDNDQDPQYKGWYSELSIQTIVYNLYAVTFTSLDAPFEPIYDVLTGDQKNAESFTTIFSFSAFLKDTTSFDAGINSLLSGENISTAADQWANTETNNAGTTITLPVYTELADGAAASRLCGSGSFGNYNKLNNRRFFYFEVTAITKHWTHTITANPVSDNGNPDNGDPVIILYSEGEIKDYEDSYDNGVTETLSIKLDPGFYVGEIYDWQHVNGTYTDQECFDVSLDYGI